MVGVPEEHDPEIGKLEHANVRVLVHSDAVLCPEWPAAFDPESFEAWRKLTITSNLIRAQWRSNSKRGAFKKSKSMTTRILLVLALTANAPRSMEASS